MSELPQFKFKIKVVFNDGGVVTDERVIGPMTMYKASEYIKRYMSNVFSNGYVSVASKGSVYLYMVKTIDTIVYKLLGDDDES